MLTGKDTETIKHFVHTPRGGFYGDTLDPQCCSASVPEGGCSVSFYQCSRRATKTLGDYGWCGPHYRGLASQLGLDMGEKTLTVYYARIHYGDPSLVKMTVTDGKKTYTIISQRNVIGDSPYYHHSIKKSELGLFPDRAGALRHLARKCASELSGAKRRVSKCEHNIKKVKKLLAEESK